MMFYSALLSVVYHLGYRREELIGQSWYTLVHPEDIGVAAALHETLGKCQTWAKNAHVSRGSRDVVFQQQNLPSFTL